MRVKQRDLWWGLAVAGLGLMGYYAAPKPPLMLRGLALPPNAEIVSTDSYTLKGKSGLPFEQPVVRQKTKAVAVSFDHPGGWEEVKSYFESELASEGFVLVSSSVEYDTTEQGKIEVPTELLYRRDTGHTAKISNLKARKSALGKNMVDVSEYGNYLFEIGKGPHTGSS